jgi:hypothetical protein
MDRDPLDNCTVNHTDLPRDHLVHKLLWLVYSKAPAVWRPGCDVIQSFLFKFMQNGMKLRWKQRGTVNALPNTAAESAIEVVLVFICRVALINNTHTPSCARHPEFARFWASYSIGGLIGSTV